MERIDIEVAGQSQTLQRLLDFYVSGDGATLLGKIPRLPSLLLTGMGASFHAARIAAIHARGRGIAAGAVEATDLLYYSPSLLEKAGHLIYVSQSGASAEIAPILDALPEGSHVTAVTNEPASPLARRAGSVLPLLGGEETLIASRTYTNSLVLLWVLVRRRDNALDARAREALLLLPGAVDALLRDAPERDASWLHELNGMETLVFAGHGPHAATARQAAMMMGEWVKRPALSFSAGALRHGFIEIIQPGVGIVLFGARGRTTHSIQALGQELRRLGATVLLSEYGALRSASDGASLSADWDEFLAPVLDNVGMQTLVLALARLNHVPPGFRHLTKVVDKL